MLVREAACLSSASLSTGGMVVAATGLCIAILVAFAAPAWAERIENTDLKYTIELPTGCRIERRAGQVEATCDPATGSTPTFQLPKAKALLFEIDAEQVPEGATPYTEEAFRAEVADAVCGTAEARLDGVRADRTGKGAMVFTASLTCPPVAMLGLDERHAQVRYHIARLHRYRLMARVPSARAEQHRPAIKAFLDSFKTTAE